MTAESFPCIICGGTLERVVEWTEAQPSDGIMCETAGNYGSTVWDSMSGERLAFNICDPCMIRAGEQGRVWTYRKYRLLLTDAGPLHRMVIGRENLRDRPHIPWHQGLAPDDEEVFVTADELESLPRSCELSMTIEEIRRLTEDTP